MTAALLALVLALLALVWHDVRGIHARLDALERAGILIRPDGPGDLPLTMSRRAKLRLAEKLSRERAQRERAPHERSA